MDTRTKKQPPWYVYIVQCKDTSLYTGITTDIERRLKEHNSSGRGARYTRTRQPVKLVYYERAESRSAAASREYLIKRLTPAKKKQLTTGISSIKPI